MNIPINKRNPLSILLSLLIILWLVPSVFAAPQADGFVPTPTYTPTPTQTLIPTALPPATNTPTTIPYPAAPTQGAQLPTDTPVVVVTNVSGNNNVPENSATAAAGNSILSFLLCLGVLLVAGLATLNIWARRRP